MNLSIDYGDEGKQLGEIHGKQVSSKKALRELAENTEIPHLDKRIEWDSLFSQLQESEVKVFKNKIKVICKTLFCIVFLAY